MTTTGTGDCPEPWDFLTIGGIYVVIHTTAQPGSQYDFQWSIYVHARPKAGYQHTMRRQAADGTACCGETSSIFKSICLTGLFLVAVLEPQPENLALMERLARSYDEEMAQTPGFTSETWCFKILQALMGNDILECDDMLGLWREILEFGNGHKKDAHDGRLARHVGESELCGL